MWIFLLRRFRIGLEDAQNRFFIGIIGFNFGVISVTLFGINDTILIGSRVLTIEIDAEMLGVEADSKDYQIIDMKLPFAGDIVRTTSVRRLNKLYFAYTDLSPEVQQAYKELISYCGGVEDLLQKSEEFLFYPESHNIMDVARYRLEHNIEFFALSEKGKKYFNLEAYAHELEELVEHKDDIILYSGCETMTDVAYYLIDEVCRWARRWARRRPQ